MTIEVPPPQSSQGRLLRYGAMPFRAFLWQKAKWPFFISLWCLANAVWDFTLPRDRLIGVLLLVAVVINVLTLFTWRRSWESWRVYLENWLIREELRGVGLRDERP